MFLLLLLFSNNFIANQEICMINEKFEMKKKQQLIFSSFLEGSDSLKELWSMNYASAIRVKEMLRYLWKTWIKLYAPCHTTMIYFRAHFQSERHCRHLQLMHASICRSVWPSCPPSGVIRMLKQGQRAQEDVKKYLKPFSIQHKAKQNNSGTFAIEQLVV